jgi:prepilin signal peptidase PulO-like enzyme (type II secretory pathway)
MIEPVLLVLVGGWISIVDARDFRIPDGPVAAGLFCIVGLCFAGQLSWETSLEGFALAGGQMGLAKAAVREELGWGDVKFALFLGGLLGPAPWGLALALSLAGVLAAYFGEQAESGENPDGRYPFAPFLTAGAIAVLLAGWSAS